MQPQEFLKEFPPWLDREFFKMNFADKCGKTCQRVTGGSKKTFDFGADPDPGIL